MATTREAGLESKIFGALLFYILTITGLFVLRRTRPDLERPYKAFGYPVLPAVYFAVAGLCEFLLLCKPVNFIWRRKATV